MFNSELSGYPVEILRNFTVFLPFINKGVDSLPHPPKIKIQGLGLKMLEQALRCCEPVSSYCLLGQDGSDESRQLTEWAHGLPSVAHGSTQHLCVSPSRSS